MGSGIRLVAAAIGVSIGLAHASTTPVVQLGMERLLTPTYENLILHRRVGVLAHYASRDHLGKHLVDILTGTPGVQVVMIFAPEHGYRSIDDSLEPDSMDPVTGLPVYSLYGPRQAPTPEMLAKLDVVVVDLQDVGMRFYTYPATVVNLLKACHEAGKPVIVLDRPDPIGGTVVEGAVLDPAYVNGGLTTLAAIPTRHGMTLGEQARMYNELLGIHANLTIVPMSGWKREMLWNDTGLPWNASSPALVTADQAQLYGVFGALETLNLAVGRGVKNENAFHNYGAPWITPAQAKSLQGRLLALRLPGLAFSEVSWTPDRGIFQGQLCHGFRIDVTNPEIIRGFQSFIQVTETMRKVLGTQLDFSESVISLGTDWLRDDLVHGAAFPEIEKRAVQDYPSFLKERKNALLY